MMAGKRRGGSSSSSTSPALHTHAKRRSMFNYGALYYAPWLPRWKNPDPFLYLLDLIFSVERNHRDVKSEEFEDEFNPGDKLYGLSNSRTQYINILKINQFPEEPYLNHTIDDLNNQVMATGYFTGDPKTLNYDETVTVADEEAIQFKIFAESHYLFDPRRVPGSVNDQDKSLRDAYVRIGRASKAGIEFTIERKNKIHFVLDNLVLSAVPQKLSYFELPENDLDLLTIQDQKEQRGGTLKDVTGQELRYIQRNWCRFKDNVIFWNNGNKVNPPWEDFGEGTAYKTTSKSEGLFVRAETIRLCWLWKTYQMKLLQRQFLQFSIFESMLRTPNLNPVYFDFARFTVEVSVRSVFSKRLY